MHLGEWALVERDSG